MWPSALATGNHPVIRDAVLKQISYGFAASTASSSLSQTAGTMDFQYHGLTTISGGPAGSNWETAYTAHYNCQTAPPETTMWCRDDPSTAKGFTGQYQDPSGLDYYNARYYDPVIGCFISADTKQGNAQGMDPYSYVNGNPETLTDPTGQVTHCHEPGDCGPGSYTTDVGGGDTGSEGRRRPSW